MARFRKNFTLSIDTLKLLEKSSNQSDTIDKAVPYYLANFKEKEDKPKKPLKVLSI